MRRAIVAVIAIVAMTAINVRPGLAAEPPATLNATEVAAADQDDIRARVVDPRVPLDQLSFLLVPLTRAQLEDVARAWQEIVRSRTEEIARLQAARLAEPAVGDEDPRIERIVQLVERRARLLERFGLVLESLERKGGDPDLVAELQAYRRAVMYEETALASTRALFGSFVTWLGRPDGGIAVLFRVGIALLAVLAVILLGRLVRRIAHGLLGRSGKMSRLLQGFLAAAIFWLVVLVGLLLVLYSIDVDITPLFALIGGASFILAFAFQDTLGNLASGLMIMANQPFDEGDYIEVGGVGGSVRKVSIVSTTIVTPDNQVIVVPNRSVWGSVIVNASASDERRVDLTFSASYEDPIQEVLGVIEREVAKHPKILNDPPPVIRANALSASSVDFVCRPWVKAEDYWDVYWDLTRDIKEAFDERGITMPYPRQETIALPPRV